MLGLAGAFLFALGGCHSSGGFCSDSFSSTHVVLYGFAVVLLSAAAGLLARAATSRRAAVGSTAGGAALLLLALAVSLET